MTPLHVWQEKERHIEAYCNWLIGVENKLNSDPTRVIPTQTKPKRQRKKKLS